MKTTNLDTKESNRIPCPDGKPDCDVYHTKESWLGEVE